MTSATCTLILAQSEAPVEPVPDAYAVIPEAASLVVVMPVLQALRRAGVKIQMHAAGSDGFGSMKVQFKKADSSGARYALIFGAAELAAGGVAVKALRGERSAAGAEATAQIIRPLGDISAWAGSLLIT